MKKNKLILIGIISLLGVSTLSYFLLKRKNNSNSSSEKVMSKTEAIALIVNEKKSNNPNNALQNFDENFLNSWANAIKNQKTVFTYNNKNYNTVGGRAVK